MTTYPTQPTGDDSVDLSNIFASNATSKIIMSTEEILNGYNNDGETVTPLTSKPDGNKFNFFWYQVHNTLAWVVNYTKALYDNKLELTGGTLSGILSMGSNRISNLATPTNNTDATTKQYVDTAVSGAMWLGEIKNLSYPTIPTLPTGMVVIPCDGRALSRTTYSTCFSLMGTTWGSGDGSTTFNIPDYRGVVMRGWDNGRGIDPGRTFGSYQADSIVAHNHGAPTSNGQSGPYEVSSVLSGKWGYDYGVESAPTTSTGGSETRMKNTTAYWVIRIK